MLKLYVRSLEKVDLKFQKICCLKIYSIMLFM